MSLFLNIILPIIAVFGIGFVLQRARGLNVQSLAVVSIYVLSPALVFSGLYEADLNSDYLIIAVFMMVLFYAMVAINKVLARIFRWDQSVESASILATGFMNSGNYGLPVVLFSFGEVALPYAIFIMIVQSIQNNFFGIYYASRSTSGMLIAFANVMKMPATYAAILAFFFQYMQVELPTPITDTVSMVGMAAIPMMMIILGMQLAKTRISRQNVPVIASGVMLKMIAAPIIASVFVWLVDVDPLIGAVLIIISAMPTAATTTMYAIEFDTQPDLVSSITFISTVISIVTLSVLLNIVL